MGSLMLLLGFWHLGKKSGYGIERWLNKEVYQGEYQDGRYPFYLLFSFVAIFLLLSFFQPRDRPLFLFRRHGYAVVTHANQDRYEGTYANGVKEGFGTMYYHTGEVYVGEWKNGLRNGGGLQLLDGKPSYSGQWLDDQRAADSGSDVYCNHQERQALTKRLVGLSEWLLVPFLIILFLFFSFFFSFFFF